MGEILNLPARPAPDPDRLISLAEFYGRRGAPVVLTLAAVLRWFKSYEPSSAAATCLLSRGGYEAATQWWRGHIAAFRRDLSEHHVAVEEVERLAAEYLAATRREVQALKAERMSAGDWVVEMVCAISGGAAPRAERFVEDGIARGSANE